MLQTTRAIINLHGHEQITQQRDIKRVLQTHSKGCYVKNVKYLQQQAGC